MNTARSAPRTQVRESGRKTHRAASRKQANVAQGCHAVCGRPAVFSTKSPCPPESGTTFPPKKSLHRGKKRMLNNIAQCASPRKRTKEPTARAVGTRMKPSEPSERATDLMANLCRPVPGVSGTGVSGTGCFGGVSGTGYAIAKSPSEFRPNPQDPNPKLESQAPDVCTTRTYTKIVGFEWDEANKAGINFRKHGVRMSGSDPGS
jgi:hypothetical protein